MLRNYFYNMLSLFIIGTQFLYSTRKETKTSWDLLMKKKNN